MTTPTRTTTAGTRPAAPMGAPAPSQANAMTVKGDTQDLPSLGNAKAATLSDDRQQALEQRRQANLMAAAISGLSWGRGMDQATARAIADYCHRYGIDPLTELDLLGGNLYVNSEYWLRRLGELRAQGYIQTFRLDHIQADPRWLEIANDAEAPEDMRADARRMFYTAKLRRAQHNVPEEAEAACVCVITLASGGDPVEGCKWGGNGTSVMQNKGQGGKNPNPIVEDNAALSVESQAVRRAMRMVASYLPAMMPNPDAMEAELKGLSGRIGEVKATMREDRAQNAQDARGRQIAALDDVYGADAPTKRLAAAAVDATVVVESGPAPVRLPEPGNDPYAHPADASTSGGIPVGGETIGDGGEIIMTDPDGPPEGWDAPGPSLDDLNAAAEAAAREEAAPAPAEPRSPADLEHMGAPSAGYPASTKAAAAAPAEPVAPDYAKDAATRPHDTLADGPRWPVAGDPVYTGGKDPLRIQRVITEDRDTRGRWYVKLTGEQSTVEISWDQARGTWSAL